MRTIPRVPVTGKPRLVLTSPIQLNAIMRAGGWRVTYHSTGWSEFSWLGCGKQRIYVNRRTLENYLSC